jgi:hypothetical protein
LYGLSNGARLLLVHSAGDIARAWQSADAKLSPSEFETGVNVAVYAAGKRDFRNRLNVEPMSPPLGTPEMTVPIARLRYGGNWDPEPGAWQRFGAWMKEETGAELDVRSVLLKELKPGEAPIAVLTGTGPQIFTDAERAAIKAYVEAGGTLVVDAAGGTNVFLGAVRSAIEPLFPDAPLKPLPRTHPLLQPGPPGMKDLSVPLLRVSTQDLKDAVNTYDSLFAGKGCVLVAPIDVTCGLLGVTAADVRGFTPAYARNLMQNTIFWTLDGQPDALTPVVPADAPPAP